MIKYSYRGFMVGIYNEADLINPKITEYDLSSDIILFYDGKSFHVIKEQTQRKIKVREEIDAITKIYRRKIKLDNINNSSIETQF